MQLQQIRLPGTEERGACGDHNLIAFLHQSFCEKQIFDLRYHLVRAGGTVVDIAEIQEKVQAHFEEFGSQGFRTMGIAYRDVGPASRITKDHEAGMTFLGFLALFDPVKSNIAETITDLHRLGVSLKIITGENRLVAAHVGQEVGLLDPGILTGPDLRLMSDEALLKKVNEVNVFAEVEPNQIERIILALKKAKNVVGYMGDGINDASALHTADVGISVDSAVDVAKDAADIVLLEKDFGVLVQGVREGRKTFANTLKYVFMATSANFGNMFSMAGASLFLPFLPLLPKQILLTNLLTDFPEMAIAADNVDKELVESPRRWNMKFIRNFMMTFGLLSSIFDYLTFGVLLFILHASPEEFRTGWFAESVLSASLVVLVIRTRGPLFQKQTGEISVHCNTADRRRCSDFALHSTWRNALWIYPVANLFSCPHGSNCCGLYRFG
jgi:Mg2+-importing ATPase